MAGANFCHLPSELVEYIVSYLPQHDIYTVTRLNKALSTLATPFLYRHVDLYIPPGDLAPRIDRFCFNILNNSRLADRVISLRLGLHPDKAVHSGQYVLRRDSHFDDSLMFSKAMDAMSNESLIAATDYLRDAIGTREYSAYAALILLVLPSLRHLAVADYKGATLDHLHTVLRNLDSVTTWNRRRPSQMLIGRLSSIKSVSINIDSIGGMAYRRDPCRPTLDHLMNLPAVEKLEISVPEGQRGGTFLFANPSAQLVQKPKATNITTLVIKHSGPQISILRSLLESTPHLKSLTYDMAFSSSAEANNGPYLVDLSTWGDTLRLVMLTLETLVLSIEYCDTALWAFKQPRIGDKFLGYLDLTYFTQLRTLQVPFPFLTGDADFSITTEIWPLLPPTLAHLSLRTDLSHAQFSFPFDTSILPSALPFHESKEEASYLMNARMDVSCMFQATLTLLEQTPHLQTISVWQPADPSLSWFDGQVTDFATTCRNKNVTGKLVYPMLLRWKKAQYWDLIREITVFDRLHPDQDRDDKFFREEWEDMPLGLSSQYHLHALHSHQVRLYR
ncbi:hypothetical protein IAQ61_001997 [Plenodomus lingam]|uniref:F-box domain-containing protein n=1 Tax=Leptosphaeria maculans (strain JN3 / isolate v23.1.3 / race Av1-4-5-6-7-8) TaxID=985895 RepID=E4ZGS3_LEPMJ|nr:hypothetical protein LEMA_P066190.1 [Plenodomus lingam JN3]KAH9878723.1 hypothetical protein IAQ61_001997 [Plenodomus lingam]CBX90493.1 hypothetical protein LEMA_P066190.1 [Plenodomus lingam JN3]